MFGIIGISIIGTIVIIGSGIKMYRNWREEEDLERRTQELYQYFLEEDV